MKSPWAVILAGGNGTRLREFTRLISGDDRPKQFCSLLGNGSLLSGTRARLTASIPSDRTLFVVVKDHQEFYEHELEGVEPNRIVVQPSNRGTTAAMIYALLRIERFEHDPVVVFFPADHYFVNEREFARSLKFLVQASHRHSGMLVLLGAQAERAEAGYGWIEPGPLLPGHPRDLWDLVEVKSFHEKPSIAIARSLLERGCLLNTFVIAGRARTFLELIHPASPSSIELFRAIAKSKAPANEMVCASELYEKLPDGDFSHDVLTRSVRRLAAVRMENAGWFDLGTPEGVLAAIHDTLRARAISQRGNFFAEWLGRYHHQLELMSLSSRGREGSRQWPPEET